MSINKINPAEKLQTVHLILEGKETQRHARARLGVSLDALQQWIRIYKSEGEGAFLVTRYKQYSKELKEQAVMDYLSGRGSLQEICQRYGIRAKSKLQNWIKKYNGHEELKASGTGGTAIMTKGRKIHIESPDKGYRRIRDLWELLKQTSCAACSAARCCGWTSTNRVSRSFRRLIQTHSNSFG